jgi:protein-L-isoaspartate O-methyltransferase
MDVRALTVVMRGGNLRARVGAVRAGQSAIRVAMTSAALDTGVLDALREPLSVDDLASRLGFADHDLLLAFVRTLEAARLVRPVGGRHETTRRGRAITDDPVARAAYTAFSDFHTGVYRDIAQQLGGGDGRRDVTDRAQVIADLSRFMQPMVEATLREEVSSRPTRSVVDLGCGSGMLLATMLQAAPDARGVGIELDPVAAQHAQENLSRHGLDGRARVLAGEARELLAGEGPFDVALLANMVYYLPVLDRPALFRTVRDALAPGGALVVVTTALTDDLFSRHFDVLIRAQQGSMELPDMDVLRAQVEEAGFTVDATRRLTPGEPLMALVATAS